MPDTFNTKSAYKSASLQVIKSNQLQPYFTSFTIPDQYNTIQYSFLEASTEEQTAVTTVALRISESDLDRSVRRDRASPMTKKAFISLNAIFITMTYPITSYGVPIQ